LPFNRLGQFANNVLKLAGGTALGQGVVLLTMPMITRMYSPSQMGVLGVFMAFVGFVSVGLGLRYEISIVSAKSEKAANYLLIGALVFSVPVSLGSGILFWGLIHWNLLSYGSLPEWSSLLMVITLLCIGFFFALRYWHVRQKNFGLISQSLLFQGSGRAAFPLIVAFWSSSWLGLLAGEVIGRLLGMLHLLRLVGPIIMRTLCSFDRDYFLVTLKSNWKYPVVVLPSSLIESLAFMLPLPIIALLFGAESAGQLLLVQRLCQLPAGLISTSVGDVFYEHLSKAYRYDSRVTRTVLWSVVKKLTLFSSIIYIPFAVLAPLLFGNLFGQEWSKTGLLVSILAPVSFTGMVVGPVSRLLFVVNRIELKLIVDVFRLVIPVSGLYWMYAVGFNFWYSVALYSFLCTAIYLFYYLLIWYAAGARPKS